MVSEPYANGYALLVGVTENAVPAWGLPELAKDIAALEQVLTHPERCAYRTENVKSLTGQGATRQGILDGLEWLQERIQADRSGNTTVVIYYTGHGWRDTAARTPQFYLIPYDVKENAISTRGLRAADLAEAVDGLRPKRLLVVLDCCHSGGMGVKGPGRYIRAAIPSRALAPEAEPSAGEGARALAALQQGSGRAVLSSSQGEQLSYIRRDGKMSIFTYHLIEALTGHAQPQLGATEVLVSDVMSYVWRQVPASARTDWDEEQEPDYQVSGNFPIALLLGGKGLAEGQAAPAPLELPASPAPASSAVEGHITFNAPALLDHSFVGVAEEITYVHDERGKTEGHVEHVGNGAQAGIGPGIQQSSRGAGAMTAEERADIARLLTELQGKVATLSLAESRKVLAADLVQELRAELTKTTQPPNASVIKGAGSWLLDNAPELAGALVGLFTNPAVGKVIQAAGSIAVDWVRQRFGPQG